MRNPKFQTSSSLSHAYVPCVPFAVSSTLVAAQPLAKRLKDHATGLVHLSYADNEKVILKRLELLEQIEVCEKRAEELLVGSVADINHLFYHLSQSLHIEGNRVEAAAMSASNPVDVQLQVKLEHLEKEAKHARGIVQAFIDLLKLKSDDVSINGKLCTGKLLDACVKKVQALQSAWKENREQALALSMQIQIESVYGAAADCLIDVCNFGLHQQIDIEPMSQVQEDIFSALATCAEFPYSGTWPAIALRVDSGHEATSSNTSKQGDAE
jgi:hypothetical protein